MRSENRVDKIIVEKIIGYCNDIETFKNIFGNTFENFQSDMAFQYACGMCIIQIGELTTRFTEDFKETHSEISWRAIKATRNIYVHDYEKIDLEEIWKTLSNDIPALKKTLEKIYSEIKDGN